ncbi:LytR C-terminal domain-containing protein [Mycobacterium sp. ITM-2016-00316]|uniref:LytR C-terminal domain-containing protein n=1 Tax=Mycobacterium sp. ITM-2016-00316 TaxID=2099695 RepID=UPI000CF9D6FA|nr:LytR C-terminal domain-containing protein [Mycobacterium sp. ITM-2016-00316]WNG82704.1 LytR C-terminal domain-containing protein [Mycobacterium sp. ITM-2016-00316]
MNQRDSSGLPLRAMVMVLLFLGVVFLLVALQYLGPDDDADGDAAVVSTTTSSATSSAEPSPEPDQARAEVRVFNISEVPGAAEGTATRLRDAEWNVTETGNLVLEGVPVTTVYFGEAPGEREAAEDVGRLLEAPVEPRRPELVEQPPGVIVVVTG